MFQRMKLHNQRIWTVPVSVTTRPFLWPCQTDDSI